MTPPGSGPDQGRDQNRTAPGPAGDDPGGGGRAADDPEERDPGLARERTSLAWTRTAISFAALGGVMLRVNVFSGLVILVIASVIWQLGRVTRSDAPGGPPASSLPVVGANRLFIIALAIAAVALLCLVIALLGRAAPGALR